MSKKQLIYLVALLMAGLFLSACGDGNKKNNGQNGKDTEMTLGQEILKDAQDYADLQCKLKRREIILANDPDVKDFDQKIHDLKLEHNKARNYYRRKYKDRPKDWVAFQNAVRSARQDSKFCQDLPKKKIRL
jgi:hypothetical protein